MKNPKVRQVVLPLITALIWGSAFVTQSLSAAHLGCFSFNALRAIPAVLVLLVLLAVMQRIHPREKYSAEEKRALLRGGLVCGAFLALAINLQQFGMGTTRRALSRRSTSCSCRCSARCLAKRRRKASGSA